MEALLEKMPWNIVIVLCLTLGLAPYAPPHLFEKIQMLVRGKSLRPMDWFDLVFHGIPWLVLVLKVMTTFK